MELARSKVGMHALTAHLTAELNRPISRSEIEDALSSLAARESLVREGERIWLSEPDRREAVLYDALEGFLRSPSLLNELGVQPGQYVFQKTATGGGRGDGPLTQPDFTLAAIQSWKFDPSRILEVFSFEVKNRAGATISAVYEAVAHGRLVHYAYLVCPRSRLDESINDAIARACVREGVGLILFDRLCSATL